MKYSGSIGYKLKIGDEVPVVMFIPVEEIEEFGLKIFLNSYSYISSVKQPLIIQRRFFKNGFAVMPPFKIFKVQLDSIPLFNRKGFPKFEVVYAPSRGKAVVMAMYINGITDFPTDWKMIKVDQL